MYLVIFLHSQGSVKVYNRIFLCMYTATNSGYTASKTFTQYAKVTTDRPGILRIAFGPVTSRIYSWLHRSRGDGRRPLLRVRRGEPGPRPSRLKLKMKSYFPPPPQQQQFFAKTILKTELQFGVEVLSCVVIRADNILILSAVLIIDTPKKRAIMPSRKAALERKFCSGRCFLVTSICS